MKKKKKLLKGMEALNFRPVKVQTFKPKSSQSQRMGWRSQSQLCFFVLFFLHASSFTRAFEVNEKVRAVPLVVNTWPFLDATRAAWKSLVENDASAVDAVVEGCSTCEALQCDGTVGFGGSPDESGETTLDAMVMDGMTMNVGAVGALRFVKNAIQTARLVLEHTEHTLLVGDQASSFAFSLGLPGPTSLSTSDSTNNWLAWLHNHCQPNFWTNVFPGSEKSCGPYHILSTTHTEKLLVREVKEEVCLKQKNSAVNQHNHDTISMIVIDNKGRIAAGTSSNGASHKIPGRVGDGPIVGASAYADQDVGACGATGDGDVMMRFLPCYQVVESMRQGLTPLEAAEDAISRIKRKYPTFVGALIAVNINGSHSAACQGWTFQYSVRTSDMKDVTVFTVYPKD